MKNSLESTLTVPSVFYLNHSPPSVRPCQIVLPRTNLSIERRGVYHFYRRTGCTIDIFILYLEYDILHSAWIKTVFRMIRFRQSQTTNIKSILFLQTDRGGKCFSKTFKLLLEKTLPNRGNFYGILNTCVCHLVCPP